jgi:hypothetical protein
MNQCRAPRGSSRTAGRFIFPARRADCAVARPQFPGGGLFRKMNDIQRRELASRIIRGARSNLGAMVAALSVVYDRDQVEWHCLSIKRDRHSAWSTVAVRATLDELLEFVASQSTELVSNGK